MQTKTLEPHAPLPEGPARRVVVLRRFDEDSPRDTVIELHLQGGGGPAEATRPHGPDGVTLDWGQAIEAAQGGGRERGAGHDLCRRPYRRGSGGGHFAARR